MVVPTRRPAPGGSPTLAGLAIDGPPGDGAPFPMGGAIGVHQAKGGEMSISDRHW